MMMTIMTMMITHTNYDNNGTTTTTNNIIDNNNTNNNDNNTNNNTTNDNNKQLFLVFVLPEAPSVARPRPTRARCSRR